MISLNKLNVNLQNPKVSVMNFLNEITNRHPTVISFAPGRPLEKNFQVKKSLEYIDSYVAATGAIIGDENSYSPLGQYGNTKGVIGKIISQLIANDEKIFANPEDIVTTVGSQEAMCLCLLGLAANPGDVVLVENPAYVGIVGAAKIFGIEIISVPTNDNGVALEELEPIVKSLKANNKTPKLLYVSPDFSNPTGSTINLERRKKLLEITRQLDLMVLEDHAYNYFFFNDSKINSLKSLPDSNHVIYLGSFSKSIYPGIRIGFLVADQKVYIDDEKSIKLSDELSKIKSFLTVNTSPLSQAIAAGLIISENYSLTSYTKKLREELKSNRNEMLGALKIHFPNDQEWCEGVSWNTPTGGFFITLKLPFNVGDDELYHCAEHYNVVWTPMRYFDIDEKLSKSIRLSFSYVTAAEINEGIKSIAAFVKATVDTKEITS